MAERAWRWPVRLGALLAVASILSVVPVSAQGSTVEVSTGHYQLTDPNGVQFVDVMLAPGAEPVAAVTLSLVFDDSLITPVLTASGVPACVVVGFVLCGPTNPTDEVRSTGINIVGWATDFTLVRIPFQGRGAEGMTPLTLAVTTLGDVNGATLPATVVNGSLTIQIPPPPTPDPPPPTPTSTPAPPPPTPDPPPPTATPDPPQSMPTPAPTATPTATRGDADVRPVLPVCIESEAVQQHAEVDALRVGSQVPGSGGVVYLVVTGDGCDFNCAGGFDANCDGVLGDYCPVELDRQAARNVGVCRAALDGAADATTPPASPATSDLAHTGANSAVLGEVGLALMGAGALALGFRGRLRSLGRRRRAR